MPTYRTRSYVPLTAGPDVDPPSGPDFGTSITTAGAGSRIASSTGTNYFVSPSGSDGANGLSTGTAWQSLQHAFDTVPTNGSIINLMAGTHSAGFGSVIAQYLAVWSRAGNSGNPVTLKNNTGASPVTDGGIAVNAGSYLAIKNLEINNGWDGVKVYPDSHHVDIDNCRIHNTEYQGVLIGGGGSPATDIQVWNCRIYDIGGDDVPDQHGIYFQTGERVTIANCLFYNMHTYGIQFESGDDDSVLITNCTISAEPRDAFGGPMVFSWGTGTNIQVRNSLLTHSDVAGGNPAIMCWSAGNGGCLVSDCIAYDVASPSFPTTIVGGGPANYTQTHNTTQDPRYTNTGTRDYTLQTGSPAINYGVDRPQWIAATDINGNARVTADAGCFRYV